MGLLVAINIILQIGDGLSTYILGVKTSLMGGVEANPLLVYLFSRIGFLPGLLFAKSFAIALLLYIYYIGKKKAVKVKKLLIFILILYSLININNWYWVTAW